MENPSNIHTRSQAESRKKFFNTNENEISLSQQFEAAEQYGLFSAKKSINENSYSNNRNIKTDIQEPKAKRKLIF